MVRNSADGRGILSYGTSSSFFLNAPSPPLQDRSMVWMSIPHGEKEQVEFITGA